MFYLIMRGLQKLYVAVSSRTLEYRIDDESGEAEFNIWRKRLTYGWHLVGDKMTTNTANFVANFGFSADEIMTVTTAVHRSWKKEDEKEFIDKEYKVGRLKRIAMIMYLYRLIRFPINYFMSFFINLTNVKSEEMYDTW